MKFKFKIQQYQTDAVESTVSVFAGQPSKTNAQYRRDLGKQKQQLKAEFEEDYVGYRNADVELNANHRVHYDSEELIQKAVAAINSELNVTQLKYVVRLTTTPSEKYIHTQASASANAYPSNENHVYQLFKHQDILYYEKNLF